jgi:RHS repeat-associated protein
MRSGTSHYYYIFDALGSVIALTDSSGAIAASYSYDPYGTTLTASGAQASVNPFRFASGYFDSATGLLKFGTRYYDPSLGRWTQRDSVAGSISDPGNLNRYVYAGNNPVNLTDPSGQAAFWPCLQLLVEANVSLYGAAYLLAPVASAAVVGAAFPPFAGLAVAAGVVAAAFGLMLEIDLISTCVLS